MWTELKDRLPPRPQKDNWMGHMHSIYPNSTTKHLKTKLGCNHSPQKVVCNLQTKSNQVDSLLKQKYKYSLQDLNKSQCLITWYSKCLGYIQNYSANEEPGKSHVTLEKTINKIQCQNNTAVGIIHKDFKVTVTEMYQWAIRMLLKSMEK